MRSKRRSSRNLAFDTEKLRDEAVLEKFCQHIHESGVSAGPEACGDWESFRDRITAAAHDSVGLVAPQRRGGGLPPDVADLVNRRRQARLNGDKPLYRSLKKAVPRALRGAEEARVREVCEQVLLHLFTSNSGPAFRAISTLSGKKRSLKSSSVFAEDGKVLEGAQALQRFAGYFEELLDVSPPSTGIDTSGLTPLIADPPISTHPQRFLKLRRRWAA